MFRASTDFHVIVEGELVPVQRLESGRLVATVWCGESHHEWHAMSLEKLQDRIDINTKPSERAA